MAITHYKTVEATTPGELDLLVAEAIADGFQPYGPPATRRLPSSDYEYIVQALIKGSPPNPQDADLSDIESRLSALEGTVGDGESGLVAESANLNQRLSEIEVTVGDEESGLVATVADHEQRIAALEPEEP